jgi:O-antigen ligase
VIVFCIGFEYLRLSPSVTLYRAVVAPLCGLSILLCIKRRYTVRSLAWATLIYGVLAFWLVSAMVTGDSKAIGEAFGAGIFVTTLIVAVWPQGWTALYVAAVGAWSIPQDVLWLLATVWRLDWAVKVAHTDGPIRFDGLHSDPNLLAVYLLAAASAKMWWLTSRRLRHPLAIGAVGTLLALDTVVILSTGSRGGAVTLAVLLLFWVSRGFRGWKRWVGLAAGVSTVLVLVATVEDLRARPYQGAEGGAASLQVVQRFAADENRFGPQFLGPRYDLWAAALATAEEQPVWRGSGIERFTEHEGQYPHNSLLDALLACGAMGAGLLCFAILSSVALGIRRGQSPYEPEFHGQLLGFSTLTSLLLLSSFTTKVFWLGIAIMMLPCFRPARIQAQSRRWRVSSWDTH